MKLSALFVVVSLGTLAGLQGCVSQPRESAAPPISQYSGYGVVDSVTQIEQRDNNSIGAGTIAGGIVGGVLGHQIGQGSGNTAATIAGAAGGAYVGNRMENANPAPRIVYRIGVRLDDGSYQSYTQDDGSFGIGEPVMIRDGRVWHRR